MIPMVDQNDRDLPHVLDTQGDFVKREALESVKRALEASETERLRLVGRCEDLRDQRQRLAGQCEGLRNQILALAAENARLRESLTVTEAHAEAMVDWAPWAVG